MAAGYFDNPYHNFRHGLDVMQMMAFAMHGIRARYTAGVTLLQTRIALVAALAHDIGHTGRTNNFLVAVRNDLAITYNDVSVQEQMHASKLLQLLGNPRMDVLDGAASRTGPSLSVVPSLCVCVCVFVRVCVCMCVCVCDASRYSVIARASVSVSYTHLTLPTIYSV